MLKARFLPTCPLEILLSTDQTKNLIQIIHSASLSTNKYPLKEEESEKESEEVGKGEEEESEQEEKNKENEEDNFNYDGYDEDQYFRFFDNHFFCLLFRAFNAHF